VSQFEQLRRLLLEPELERFDSLERRIQDRERRAREVAEVLPRAVKSAYGPDAPALALALQAPVEHCIRSSIKRDPKFLADTLYPVILPAIRRSINESFKALFRSISVVLDQSLSLRGIAWRWESLRSGVPFSEVVLRHTLIYQVEQVYLIHRPSGLLIDHATTDVTSEIDNDAVSGMLTAIADFVNDSFSRSDDTPLNSMVVGDRSVWVETGPHAAVAVVIRGLAPERLRETMKTMLEGLHRDLGHELAGFSGDRTAFADTGSYLSDCLGFETRGTLGTDRRASALKAGLGAAALILAASFGVKAMLDFDRDRDIRRFLDALDGHPGVIVTGHRREGGRTVVRGFRDPLAVDPDALAGAEGMETDALDFRLEPFHAVNPEFVLYRARRLLRPPPQVALSLDGTTLTATGEAPGRWIEDSAHLAHALAGVAAFDGSGVSDVDARTRAALDLALTPPPGVTLDVADGRLRVTGEAPLAWVRRAQALLRGSAHPVLARFDVAPVEQRELRRLAREVRAIRVEFDLDGELTDPGEAALNRLRTRLPALQALAADLGVDLQLGLQAVTAPRAAAAEGDNESLAPAEVLRDSLRLAGVAVDRMVVMPVARSHSPEFSESGSSVSIALWLGN
jgi:OOP family OmpA-OmpF porin